MIEILLTLLGLNTFTVTKIPTNTVQYQDGQKIYKTTCIKCHNPNPHKPGNIGPDLYTTPKDVFKSKVLTGTYPKGYTPKRKTRVMPRFKHLETKVDEIYNYIQSIKK